MASYFEKVSIKSYKLISIPVNIADTWMSLKTRVATFTWGDHFIGTWARGGGGALNFFLGGCVPRGFQNVGSRERIFLKKMGVLGTKIWKILGLERSDFGQNIVENAKIF